MNFDTDWNFEKIVNNIEAIKSNYLDSLASFSYFNLNDKVSFTKILKNKIYSLKIQDWKKDIIWEYLNNDKNLEDLTKYL